MTNQADRVTPSSTRFPNGWFCIPQGSVVQYLFQPDGFYRGSNRITALHDKASFGIQQWVAAQLPSTIGTVTWLPCDALRATLPTP